MNKKDLILKVYHDCEVCERCMWLVHKKLCPFRHISSDFCDKVNVNVSSILGCGCHEVEARIKHIVSTGEDLPYYDLRG